MAASGSPFILTSSTGGGSPLVGGASPSAPPSPGLGFGGSSSSGSFSGSSFSGSFASGGAAGAVRPSGHLIVKLYKAKNLPRMAKLLGKTDCYCIIHLVDPGSGIVKTWKTSTKSNDLSPSWKAEYDKNLRKCSVLPSLQFEFWHHETVGSDRLIGRATLDLSTRWSAFAHPPLYQGKIPIALEGKKKPSDKAKLSLAVLSVGWMPDYQFLKSTLESQNRLHTGDGSKRVTVPLVEALGKDVFLMIEFTGKKCELYLFQKIDASMSAGSGGGSAKTEAPLWTRIQLGPPLAGQVARSTKIRRYSGKGSEYWSLKEHSVQAVKKMQDLKVWSHWNRIHFQSFEYGTVFEITYAQLHQSFVRQPDGVVNPSTYEETKTQVQGSGVICNDIETTVYYPVSIAGDTPTPVGFLSTKFGAKTVDCSLWIFQSAHERGLFIDLSYEQKKKRTENHFKAPKLVQGLPCIMSVSLPDLKLPFPRGFIHIRVLFAVTPSLRTISLNDALPGVFQAYPKTKTV